VIMLEEQHPDTRKEDQKATVGPNKVKYIEDIPIRRVTKNGLESCMTQRTQLLRSHGKFEGLPDAYRQYAKELAEADHKEEANQIEVLAQEVEGTISSGTWPLYSILQAQRKASSQKDKEKVAGITRQVADVLHEGNPELAVHLREMADALEDVQDDFYNPGVAFRKAPYPFGISVWRKPDCRGRGSIWSSEDYNRQWVQRIYSSLREDDEFAKLWKQPSSFTPLEDWYFPKGTKAKQEEKVDTGPKLKLSPSVLHEERCKVVHEKLDMMYSFFLKKTLQELRELHGDVVTDETSGKTRLVVSDFQQRLIDKDMLTLLRDYFIELKSDRFVDLALATRAKDTFMYVDPKADSKKPKLVQIDEAKVLQGAYPSYDAEDVTVPSMPCLEDRWKLLLLHTVPDMEERATALTLLGQIRGAAGYTLDSALKQLKSLMEVFVQFTDSAADKSIQALLHCFLACVNYLNHEVGKGEPDMLGLPIEGFSQNFIDKKTWQIDKQRNLLNSAMKHLSAMGITLAPGEVAKALKQLQALTDTKEGSKPVSLTKIQITIETIYQLRQQLVEVRSKIQPISIEGIEDALLPRVEDGLRQLDEAVAKIGDSPMRHLNKVAKMLIIRYERYDTSPDGELWITPPVTTDEREVREDGVTLTKPIYRLSRQAPQAMETLIDVKKLVHLLSSYMARSRAFKKAALLMSG